MTESTPKENEIRPIGSVTDYFGRAWAVALPSRRIRCVDGTTVSIQASRTHYATPRDNDGPYTHIEVGFPSVPPPASWMEYAEEPANPTGTVYGYMPFACVHEFIAAHGGIDAGELPPEATS